MRYGILLIVLFEFLLEILGQVIHVFSVKILNNKIRKHVCCILTNIEVFFGMLYRTYKVVVEQCLPAAIWAVTVAIDISKDMLVVQVDICRSHVVLQQHSFYWMLL